MTKTRLGFLEFSDSVWTIGMGKYFPPKERRAKNQTLRNHERHHGFSRNKSWKTEKGCWAAIRRLEKDGLPKGEYAPMETMYMGIG